MPSINLSTKLVHNPSFARKLAKIADEKLLNGQKRLVFKTKLFPGRGDTPPHPSIKTALSLRINEKVNERMNG